MTRVFRPGFVALTLLVLGSASPAAPDAAPGYQSPAPRPGIGARHIYTFDPDKLAVALPGMIVDMFGRGYTQTQLYEAIGALFDRHTEPRIQPFGDLSVENLEAHLQASVARRRAALVAQVQSADTDWDGIVTRAELEVSHRHRDAEDELERFDSDHDDAISPEELRAGARRLIGTESTRLMLTRMLEWDFNGDGRTSRSEALALVSSRYIQQPPEPR